MSAEGMPRTEPSYLARPLGMLTRLVVRFPWQVIVAALVVAVLSVGFAARCMDFRASRLDLLNPSSNYNQRWLAYLEEFGDQDDVVVVVEASDPARVVPVVDELADRIAREDKLFHAVLHKHDLSAIRAKGLHLLSESHLFDIHQQLSHVDPILKNNWNTLDVDQQLQQINQGFAAAEHAPNPEAHTGALLTRTQRIARQLSQVLTGEPSFDGAGTEFDRLAKRLEHLDSKYLLSSDGQLGFLLLRIVRSEEQLVQGSEAIDRLRALLDKVQTQHSEVRIGLTGMPILENDEMRASQSDMIRASVLSLLGVACLFITGFGGVRHPIMTVSALVLAIAWSFGYITLAVGHLNILSVSFGVILIGLGIDFGIHYVARYLQLRKTTPGSDDALVQTATSVGPGIVTGGITTALAFSTAVLTDFTGVSELGIIAGGGILLCIVAALVVLPAMIYLADKDVGKHESPAPLPTDKLLGWVARLPRFVLVIGLTLTVMVGCGAFWLRFDHNLLNMQPTELASVQWERRLIDKSDRSVWFALCTANNPAELLELKSQLETLDTVGGTHEIASLLQASSPENIQVIQRIGQQLKDLPASVPVIPVAPPERLEQTLAQLESSLRGARQDAAVVATVADLRQQVASMNRRQFFERLSLHQQGSANQLLDGLTALRGLANPDPPRLDDLPSALRTRFVGKNNKQLLKVFARGDIWDMDQLQTFVHDVERVEEQVTGRPPRVTGHPVQTFYASRQMQQSYIHAAVYSLILVSIVLVLDFQSVRMALLALLPMGLGALQLFGILGLCDIPLNPANMIVLPLILGIGIDDGVHVVHDFRRQSGRFTLSRSTATAVLITSATTMVGFGTLMFAKHQGLRSLGQVLVIGVFCCLGTSIVVLPALLALLAGRRSADSDDEASSGNDEQLSDQMTPSEGELSVERDDAEDKNADDDDANEDVQSVDEEVEVPATVSMVLAPATPAPPTADAETESSNDEATRPRIVARRSNRGRTAA